jgi:hypothetical protein
VATNNNKISNSTTEIDNIRNFEFHMEEFKQLKAEIILHQNMRFQIETFAATAVFVTTSYLFSNEQTFEAVSVKFIWWLPTLITITAFSISAMISQGMTIAGCYIKKIECLYGMDGQGWENYLHPEGMRRKGVRSIIISKIFFWTFLAATSMSIAFTMTFLR